MYAVEHLDAAGLQQLGELAEGVLCLGDGQPVAGDDDDLAGVTEQDRNVLGRPGAHGAVLTGPRSDGDLRLERAEQRRRQGAPHRGSHQAGQDGAAGADESAGDDQQHVAEDIAAGRHRQAGEGVQQRDDDRHVRAADRQDEEHTHEQRHCSQGAQQQAVDRPVPQVDDDRGGQRDCCEQRAAEDERATGEDHRSGGHELLQLHERDDRSREGDRADEHRERTRRGRDRRHVRRVGQFYAGDKRSSSATDTVEERDQLRHLRHRDATGGGHTDGGPDDDRADDQTHMAKIVGKKRDQNRQHGATGTDQVAATGRSGRGQTLEREDEADCGDQIGNGGPGR